MSNDSDKIELIDPTQDRYAILNLDEGRTFIKKHPTKDFIFERNDGQTFKSAHNNPWYVMMTIKGKGPSHAEANRRYWHGFIRQNFYEDAWLAQAPKAQVSSHGRAVHSSKFYAKALDVDESEFATLTDEDNRTIDEALEKRCGSANLRPKPDEDMDLRGTLFLQPFACKRMLFLGIADFTSSHFARYAGFESSHFARFASFSASHFAGVASFRSSHFAERAIFTDSSFAGPSVFRMIKFDGPTFFTGANFETYVPDFSGTPFNQETRFSDEESDVKLWPPTHQKVNCENTKFERRYPETLQDQKAQQENYNLIRQFMQEQKRVEAESFFHRRELDLQLIRGNPVEKVAFGVFKVTSNFGHSIGFPILWLISLIVLFGWLYASFPDTVFQIEGGPQRHPFGLALSNTFGYLGFTKLYFGDVLKQAPGILQIYVALQSILSIILQFLLGLGIRSRFRLR